MSALTLVQNEPVLGSITPRLWTTPLVKGPPGPCGCGCALDVDTSYGFAVDIFAKRILERPLYPWQRWLVIHAGELKPDGTPRFVRVLVTVARQNGKTHCAIVLTLYWLFIEQIPMILGTSTQTAYAQEPWKKAYELAITNPELKEMMSDKDRDRIRSGTGREDWWTAEGCHYKVTAANAEGGRSLTIHRVLADELAKQYNYKAHAAAFNAMNEVKAPQYWGLTTPDPKGVVYLGFRKEALGYIEAGTDSPDLGLFEWSAPEDSDPMDLSALAQAQPNLGRTKARTQGKALNRARAAVTAGGEALIEFKADDMCLLLANLNPAIDIAAWRRNREDGDLHGLKNIAMCFDVSTNGKHATLYAAAGLSDGRTRVDFFREWTGDGCANKAMREMPALFAQMKVKPRVLGYLPSGPGAAVMADMETSKLGVWPPRGVTVSAIRGETTAVCMGFEQLVVADKVIHSGDPLLDAHIEGAERLKRGDAWVFSRKNPDEECDALYAAAGATHLARTLAPGLGKMRLVGPSDTK